MMRAAGTLFLGKTAPLATHAADGAFVLTLLAFDRIGPHQVEPWRITWTGQDAEAFYTTQRANLKAGQPLTVDLQRLRTFALGRMGTSEITAIAARIGFSPLAHEINHQPAHCVHAHPLTPKLSSPA